MSNDDEMIGAPDGDFGELGRELGALVADKNRQYGDSVRRAGTVLAVYFPDGLPPHSFQDALLIVRVLDKISRISQRGSDGHDLGGESPWQDIAGYGLIGWRKDRTLVVPQMPVPVAPLFVVDAAGSSPPIPAPEAATVAAPAPIDCPKGHKLCSGTGGCGKPFSLTDGSFYEKWNLCRPCFAAVRSSAAKKREADKRARGPETEPEVSASRRETRRCYVKVAGIACGAQVWRGEEQLHLRDVHGVKKIGADVVEKLFTPPEQLDSWKKEMRDKA